MYLTIPLMAGFFAAAVGFFTQLYYIFKYTAQLHRAIQDFNEAYMGEEKHCCLVRICEARSNRYTAVLLVLLSIAFMALFMLIARGGM